MTENLPMINSIEQIGSGRYNHCIILLDLQIPEPINQS